MAEGDKILAAGVVMNPRIGSGRPTLAESRIGIWAIAGRFRAGESPESIAEDYEISVESVFDGLRFACKDYFDFK